MKFNCILEFFSLLYFKERKRRKRNQSERERGGEGSVYLGRTGSTKHSTTGGQDLSHRKAMCGASEILSYCAHSSESLRTPNNEYITYSQKLDLEPALQVKTQVPEAPSSRA